MPNMDPKKCPMPSQEPNVRNKNFKEVALGYTEEMAVNEAKRCLQCKNHPCRSGCPVEIDIPGFIKHVAAGDVLGTVQETSAILHKIMVPPGVSGTVKSIEKGEFTVDHVVAVLEDYNGKTRELTMVQNWPVRIARPYSQK